ncbi:AAA family ATPase [Mariniblastus sp.]|nr:AAA family ATPase [Mariniblastus sp.]
MSDHKKRTRSNIEATERALIGSALLEPSIIDTLSGRIGVSDFYDPQLGSLFSVLVDRNDAGLPSDTVTLLSSAKGIFGATAAATLAELFNEVPHVGHAEYYASQVAEAAKRRKLEIIADDIRDMANDDTRSADEVAELAVNRLESVGTHESGLVTSVYDAGTGLIDSLNDGNSRRPIFTGIDSVDRIVGGLLPGEFQIIAGRPGSGKSAFAMQVAKKQSDVLRPVLLVSLEMTKSELVTRILCGMTGIDSRIIRRGQASDEMKVSLKEANDDLNETPLLIYDKPAPTVQTIRALAKIQKAHGGLDLLVVDYIGLITPRDRRISRHEQVGEITGMLKQIAKELEVPVIALSQLNREADGAEPKLSHLRESGSIEQDADIVLFIHRAGNDSKLIVGKHRHGDTGSFPITFDAARTRFC